jgi:phospholipase C
MSSTFLTQARRHLALATSLFALIANLGAPLSAEAQDQPSTDSPIKRVIVIIGENRTFSHVFATCQPKSSDTVSSLGIVNEDGTPGLNFPLAAQSSAVDSKPDTSHLNSPDGVAYPVLPPVPAGGYTTAPFPDATTAEDAPPVCLRSSRDYRGV